MKIVISKLNYKIPVVFHNLFHNSGETRKTFHKNILLSFHHMLPLKKHFIMYLLNNKNYLCKKIIRRKNRFCYILCVLFTKNTVKPV